MIIILNIKSSPPKGGNNKKQRNTVMESVFVIERTDEMATEMDTHSGLSASAVLLRPGQIGHQRVRPWMDDEIGSIGVHPLIFDDHLLLTVAAAAESEAILCGRWGHHHRDPVPLQSSFGYIM